MARTLGLGTVLKYDTTTITLAVSNTPPPRRRARVNGVTLGDTLATDSFGIEEQSDYTFTCFIEPNDTQHAAFHTAFGSKTSYTWHIVFASADDMAFAGTLVAIEPQGVAVDNLVQEQYTVHRTGAISWT